jgi:putative ABC transport system permease protein
VLLSLAGGAAGLALGFGGVRALLAATSASLPRLGANGSAIAIDWRVLGFTLAVALGTGILFGILPAFSASRMDLNSGLKEGASRTGSGFRMSKTRSLLVVSEVSLALVLLIAATLLIRSFIALHSVGPGFDAHNVLTGEMSMTGDALHKTVGIAELSREARQRLSAVPGVEAAANTVWLPNQVDDALGFSVIGRPGNRTYGGRWMSFSPGYLSVFKIPVERGRDFNETDTLGNPGVVLINEELAKEVWKGEDPVGQRILIGSGMDPTMEEPPRTIVGIVGDTHNNGLGNPPDAMMMVPTAQVVDGYAASYSDTSAMLWVVRTRGDPHAVIPAFTEQLRLASGNSPVAHIRTMEEVMGRSTSHENLTMLLLSIFGAVALLLAAVGIYGLMAYSVAQRTQEMGIRMALGADRSAIRRLVVWHGMRLALVGVGLGVCVAFALTRLIASFLFGVKPWDPAVFAAVPFVLAMVALISVWLPAARAARVDPIEALRTE